MEKVQLALHDAIHKMLFSASVPDVAGERVEAHVAVIVKAIREMKRGQQDIREKCEAFMKQTAEKEERELSEDTDELIEKLKKLKLSSEEMLRLWVAMQ